MRFRNTSLKDTQYFKQAELMIKTIPHVAAKTCFALKGGTAINLFVRDMPRLSVDIDLTYPTGPGLQPEGRELAEGSAAEGADGFAIA
jgi:predicted nucleotidyltransferase component of viral defense system